MSTTTTVTTTTMSEPTVSIEVSIEADHDGTARDFGFAFGTTAEEIVETMKEAPYGKEGMLRDWNLLDLNYAEIRVHVTQPDGSVTTAKWA